MSERLKFKSSLQGVPNAELLKRLRSLHQELMAMDQETVDTNSLTDIARALISPALLIHKERGVKAYTACALVDILRLYAPEAPYTGAELKDIFQFLFTQLKYLNSAKEPHFAEYFYLIESFSNVKSIVLICDLDDADELMTEIFKQCFDVISSESPKNVEICMTEILLALIEEAATLTSEVIDILLAQFLPRNAKAKPASYRLAVDVCTGASDKLQRHVSQYFADVIKADDNDHSADSSDEDEKPTKKGVATLSGAFVTAHSLIKQLNRSVPSLLLNVIPLLEEELSASQGEYRKLATEVLGAMFGEKIGQGDLASKYPGTWRAWLNRRLDKLVVVRIALAESLKKVWAEHAELGADIEVTMEHLLVDTDEKVRVAACTVFHDMEFETACHRASVEILKELSGRVTDRKPAVRAVAFEALGRLYNSAFSQIEGKNESCVKHFGWIPAEILRAAIMEITARSTIMPLVAKTLQTLILPLPHKDAEDGPWVDRFLIVAQHLNEVAFKTLISFSHIAERQPSPFERFVGVCEKNNGGVIDDNEKAIKDQVKTVLKVISASFANPAKATEDLSKFAKANEKQLYKLLRTLVDIQTDVKTLIKTKKEVLRRLELVSPSIVDTFTTLIEAYTFPLLNKSSIPTLLKRAAASDGNKSLASTAVKILNVISKSKPAMYQSHTAELTKLLGVVGDERLTTVALHALSKLAKWDPSVIPDKKLSEKAKAFSVEDNADQARFAATIVALDSSRLGAADDVLSSLADNLAGASSKELVAHLAALGRIARYAPNAFETRSTEIITFLLSDVLAGDPDVDDEIEEQDWVADEDLSAATKSRVLAVKVLVNRCIPFAQTPDAEKISTPVFNLLWSILKKDEDHSKYIASTASRLRLTSALSMLKLVAADNKVFGSQIAVNFSNLAWTAQDSCFEVRQRFITKLCSLVRENKILSPKLNMVLFLVAHDPEEELISAARSLVTARVRFLPPDHRKRLFEEPFVRLLHLLAHHPDFIREDDAEEMKSMAKYIELYIECLASAENISLLYHLAGRIKTLRDRGDQDSTGQYSENLYLLSELSQHLFKNRSTAAGWAISTYPGKPNIPAELFASLDMPTAKAVQTRQYLSADVLLALGPGEKKQKVRSVKVKPEPKPKVTSAKSTPKKRKSAGSAKRAAKSAKRNNDESDTAGESASNDDDSDISMGDSDDEAKPKVDKKTPVAKPRATRTGLRASGGANGNGKPAKSRAAEILSESEEEE